MPDRRLCRMGEFWMVYESYTPKDTFRIAYEMGRQIKPGEVVCLNGDLGTGKTLFSQGFAKGLGIEDSVNSPTFTIVQQYDEGRMPLYHFDVYRIEDSEEMDEIGFADMIYGDGVCLIEWAERINDILPERYISVTIGKDLKKGFDYRRIVVEPVGEMRIKA